MADPDENASHRESFSILETANKLFSDGQLLKARELFTDVLERKTPYHPVAYVNRSCVHTQLGYPELAAGDAYRAIMLLEYVRAALEGMEDDAEDEEENGERDESEVNVGENGGESCHDDNKGPEEGGTREEAETEEELASSLSTNIATNAFSTIVLFLKHSKKLPDDHEFTRLQISEFAANLDKLASYYLINALRQASSLLDAFEFCESTLQRYPQSPEDIPANTMSDFLGLKRIVMAEMDMKIQRAVEKGEEISDPSGNKARAVLSAGVAKREKYPWNIFEPDRFSEESLALLNGQIEACSVPVAGRQKVEARVISLPDLSISGDGGKVTESKHLAIFAKEDIPAGEIFFAEKRCISGWPHPGQQTLCDYCTAKLDHKKPENIIYCPKCDGNKLPRPAYCSNGDLELAIHSHHPPLCGKEEALAWIYDDIIASPNPIATYNTLLIKIFSTAINNDTHPLDLESVKYLYGVPERQVDKPSLKMRWDFLSCVVRPILILSQGLGFDPYSSTGIHRFDTWVINTLMAKIMGTCSGRFEPEVRRLVSPTGAAAEDTYQDDRPDVVCIYPTWSLVNHDCEPNVKWRNDTGKSTFVALRDISKDEEIKTCYTDVKLDYKARRDWAKDMLGGDCRCRRCLREEQEEVEKGLEKLGV